MAGRLLWTSDDWDPSPWVPAGTRLDSGAVSGTAIVDVDGNLYVSDRHHLWSSGCDGKLRWVSALPQEENGESYPIITPFFTRTGQVGGVTVRGRVLIYDRDSGRMTPGIEGGFLLPGLLVPEEGNAPSLVGSLMSRLLWNTCDPADPYMMDPEMIRAVGEVFVGVGMPVGNSPTVLPDPVDPALTRVYVATDSTLNRIRPADGAVLWSRTFHQYARNDAWVKPVDRNGDGREDVERVGIPAGLAVTSPHRILLPLTLGYRLDEEMGVMGVWPTQAVLVVLDRDGHPVAGPYEVPDVIETTACAGPEGDLYIAHVSSESSVYSSLYCKLHLDLLGLPLQPPIEPVGGGDHPPGGPLRCPLPLPPGPWRFFPAGVHLARSSPYSPADLRGLP